MSNVVRVLVALALVAPAGVPQAFAPPATRPAAVVVSSTPDVPERFGPVPGTTDDDLARWEALLRDAFLDPDRRRAARLTMIARLESYDIVDLTPAILNVGRNIDFTDPEAYRGVADLYAWWQVQTVRTPTFVWLLAVLDDEDLQLVTRTSASLGQYWNAKWRGAPESFDTLRDKIARRRAERSDTGAFVPSVPPVDGDERALAETGRRLFELRHALREAISWAARTGEERAEGRSSTGFHGRIPADTEPPREVDDVEDEIRRVFADVGPIHAGPALVNALRRRGDRAADVASTARLVDLWSQRTGGVPAIDFPADPDASAERVAGLARLASWLEATIRDPHALGAWRAAVARTNR